MVILNFDSGCSGQVNLEVFPEVRRFELSYDQFIAYMKQTSLTGDVKDTLNWVLGHVKKELKRFKKNKQKGT